MLDTTIRLIRLPEVRRLTGLSRTALYDLAAQGKLKPVKITQRASAWLESEVSEFIAERIRASRAERATHLRGSNQGARAMKVPPEALHEILALPEGPERARLLDACSLYEGLAPEEEDVLYRLGVALAAGREPKALVMAELFGRAKPPKQNRSSG